MKRREFITLVGVSAAWPLAARAQQGDRVRLLAAMMGGRNADTDSEGRAWFAAFRQGLQELAGWRDATFAPTIAGPRATSIVYEQSQRNSLI